MLAEEADKVTVGVEDFHPVIECICDIYVALLIQRDPLRGAEVARGCQVMVLATGPDGDSSLSVSASKTMTWSCCVSTT